MKRSDLESKILETARQISDIKKGYDHSHGKTKEERDEDYFEAEREVLGRLKAIIVLGNSALAESYQKSGFEVVSAENSTELETKLVPRETDIFCFDAIVDCVGKKSELIDGIIAKNWFPLVYISHGEKGWASTRYHKDCVLERKKVADEVEQIFNFRSKEQELLERLEKTPSQKIRRQLAELYDREGDFLNAILWYKKLADKDSDVGSLIRMAK